MKIKVERTKEKWFYFVKHKTGISVGFFILSSDFVYHNFGLKKNNEKWRNFIYRMNIEPRDSYWHIVNFGNHPMFIWLANFTDAVVIHRIDIWEIDDLGWSAISVFL